MNFNLLRNTSNEEITMLKDINNLINIDKSGKFKFCYISKLDENQFYTLIPAISIFGKDNDPHLILSKQILITYYSSSNLLQNFLSEKLDRAIFDFGITNLDLNQFYLILKYKKVNIDFTKLA